jgi:tetratricopeptide (TPR) repeat protein
MTTHMFLVKKRLSKLSGDQRSAIEAGFKEALSRNYADAANGLGGYYRAVGQLAKAGEVYDGTAKTLPRGLEQSGYFMAAGNAYLDAGDAEKARLEFERAKSATSDLEVAYGALVVLASRRHAESEADTLIAEAAKNGVDPASLYVDEALVEQLNSNYGRAEMAARQAVAIHPSDFDALRVLGSIYMAQGKSSQAVEVWRRVCDAGSASAEDFYLLGTAAEADYEFSAADKAFRRAVALAPNNSTFKARLDAFTRKLIENHPQQSNAY